MATMAISCHMNAQGLKAFLEDVTVDLHLGLTGARYNNAPFSSGKGGDGLMSIHIGTRASKPFMDIDNKTYLYAGLGVDYTPKGGALAYNREIIGSSMLHANYIEIPIHVGINRRITRGISIFVEGGTYMAYGIEGESTNPDPHKEDVKIFEEVLTPFDAGVLFRFGTNYGKSFRIEFGENLGLIDVNKKNSISKLMLRSDKVYMSAGYMTLSWKIFGTRKNTGVRE